MSISPAAVAYSVVGGLVAYSGIKGATLSDTVKAVLQGNLSLSDTQTVDFGSSNSAAPANGPTQPSSGPVQTGSQVTDGTTIYKYFRANGFSPMQAAGAIASMWGESGWNPESVGTGGNGLIGWTPPLPGIVTGNANADMAKQLPLILSFISQNGDSGYVSMMAGASSVNAAAQIWDQHVERAGINDVHPTGISLAQQIAKTVDGVSLP